MPVLENIIDKKFNNLLVLELDRKEKMLKGGYKYFYLCKCDCGNSIVVERHNVRQGHTKSCGCYKLKINSLIHKTHGLSNSKIYAVYKRMIARCFNKNTDVYSNYGGRGITVCNEWKESFENFYEWCLNNGYILGLTIDRIDNNGNYEPNNCRWVDRKTQARNRRTNRLITYNNQTLTLKEWSEIYNIKPETLYKRLMQGWSIEKTLNQKVTPNGK